MKKLACMIGVLLLLVPVLFLIAPSTAHALEHVNHSYSISPEVYVYYGVDESSLRPPGKYTADGQGIQGAVINAFKVGCGVNITRDELYLLCRILDSGTDNFLPADRLWTRLNEVCPNVVSKIKERAASQTVKQSELYTPTYNQSTFSGNSSPEPQSGTSYSGITSQSSSPSNGGLSDIAPFVGNGQSTSGTSAIVNNNGSNTATTQSDTRTQSQGAVGQAQQQSGRSSQLFASSQTGSQTSTQITDNPNASAIGENGGASASPIDPSTAQDGSGALVPGIDSQQTLPGQTISFDGSSQANETITSDPPALSSLQSDGSSTVSVTQSEDPVSKVLSGIAATIVENKVLFAGIVALPVLIIALIGAFMIAGGEDYEPKTKLGARFVDWRRRRRGEGKLFDEQPYVEEEDVVLGAPKNMNVLPSAGM